MKGTGANPLRVLAADDSAVMRGVLRTVFELHAREGDRALPRMELCGLVSDGTHALEAVRTLRPDVLLLDLEMPRMNGLRVLEHLRTEAPGLPVIMCSAHTERGAKTTLDALALGAKDYVMKPGQQRDFAAALDTLMEQLLPKIAELCGWRRPVKSLFPRTPQREPGTFPVEAPPGTGTPVEVVVIGVSTGGPSALEVMLPMLPKSFRVPVLIVQHMPKLFTGALAERLNRHCTLPVREARDGGALEPGTVWLAPGDAHLEVAEGGCGRKALRLHRGPALNSCVPSADYLFRSAAKVYGAGTLALVMTGMGSDGLDGARAVKESGGTVLIQDEASSAVWGMPGRVAQAGLASEALPLNELAATLIQRVTGAETARTAGRSAGWRGLGVRDEVLHGVL